MKKLTLGRRITLGFGTLLLVTALLGGVTVINMKRVQRSAALVAEKIVPESEVTGHLTVASGRAQREIRSYGLTADGAYLEAGRKAMKDVRARLQAAEQLARAHTQSTKFQADLTSLNSLLGEYERSINETEVRNREVSDRRQAAKTADITLAASISKLSTSPAEKLDRELKESSDTSKLIQRWPSVNLMAGLCRDLNALRVILAKTMESREPKEFEETLRTLGAVETKVIGLSTGGAQLQITDELEAVKKDLTSCRERIQQLGQSCVGLSELAGKRSRLADQVTDSVEALQDAGMDRTLAAAKGAGQTLGRISYALGLGLIVALAVGAGTAMAIIRGINRVLNTMASDLDDGSDQVAAASHQVSGASQCLAEGASQQAASLEETSASLEEISSMTKRNAENAEHAKQLANQTRTAADSGARDMQDMSSAMAEIKASSDSIAKIIKTIDEIAFQTNILALNAAVEAVRAGEAGMGFAVVADEVRNLAQRSALAAKETAAQIEDSIQKSDRGVQISGKVAQSLTEMVEKARQVDELVAEIATASREQSQGIQQVNTAITEMDKVTQSTAASAEESASASEELSAQAMTLKQAVTQLIGLVGAATRSKNTPAVAKSLSAHSSNPAVFTPLSPPASKRKKLDRVADPHPVPTLAVGSKRRENEIPMPDDFKDF